jgi:hypothetical protein
MVLNERRKVTAHLKSPLDPAAIHMRLIGAGDEPVARDFDTSNVDTLLRTDAEVGMVTATQVVRGGFLF